MIKSLVELLDVMMPLFVAAVTTIGVIMVAKIEKVNKAGQALQAQVAKVQADIVTNHGSKNLGDAIDIIRTKVDVIGENQDDLIGTVKLMHKRDNGLDERISTLEEAAGHALEASVKAEKVATDSIQIVHDTITNKEEKE